MKKYVIFFVSFFNILFSVTVRDASNNLCFMTGIVDLPYANWIFNNTTKEG